MFAQICSPSSAHMRIKS